MANRRFDEQMKAFGQWKTALTKGIQNYQAWLDKHEMANPEDELRIYEILESLRSDRLTIAFVAEFARGKTELINAIFFSEYDRRLLPSEAGRTTMCPTELFYDSSNEKAFIRLLPIETRLKETSIAEYKAEPIHWTNLDLDLSDPESMAEAFHEVIKTKRVPVDEAKKLGLFSEHDDYWKLPDGSLPSEIDIPMWRHALISFPHPLLKQGLVILDTPGLNAIGSEPELTLNMLPNAHAVLFVLAADTGVTKSDLDMWKHNVVPLRSQHTGGIIVVLNKIDTLWDDLKDGKAIDKSIRDQQQRASQTLGVPAEKVLPVSAQKGLLAKIRHDTALLGRSNLLTLEAILASEILPYKQSLVRERVATEVGGMIQETRDVLKSRLDSASKQLDELRGLSGKNVEVIEHLMKKTREEQVAYHKNVESFQANKRILGEKSKQLMDLLSLPKLDKLVADTRETMQGSWTTHGLKLGMKQFFDGTKGMLTEVDEFADQLNRLIVTIYRKFHKEHGIAEIEPVLYTTKQYLQELERLYQEGEAFRNSPVTTMTEQSFVVKKFFITLVSHVRNVFFKAHRDAEKWGKAVMTPLVRQIKVHKEQMEKRLENLRKINESRDTLQTRIDELEKLSQQLRAQFSEIDAILRLINEPLDEEPAPEPRKAAGA